MDCLRKETVSVSGRSGAQSSVASTRRQQFKVQNALQTEFVLTRCKRPISAERVNGVILTCV